MVTLAHRPYVKDGQWTFGIFDMWTKKAKVAKQSVHIPCWDRCRGPTCPRVPCPCVPLSGTQAAVRKECHRFATRRRRGRSMLQQPVAESVCQRHEVCPCSQVVGRLARWAQCQTARCTATIMDGTACCTRVLGRTAHVTCLRSCNWNPCKWRAFCFGRTGNECCMTGLDRFRWARRAAAFARSGCPARRMSPWRFGRQLRRRLRAERAEHNYPAHGFASPRTSYPGNAQCSRLVRSACGPDLEFVTVSVQHRNERMQVYPRRSHGA